MGEKKHIQEVVEKLAEEHGWFVRRVQWTGKRRAPDDVFIGRLAGEERTIWIEFKDRGKGPRGFQADEHEEMRKAGAEVYVVDSIRRSCEILGLPFTRDPLRPHL